MPLNRYVVRVDPQGQTVVVDVLDTSGASVIAYESSQFGAATLTLPLTITAQTDFWLHDPGAYDISCKVGGAEVADAGAPKRVQLSDVPVLVVPDWERERTASPGGSTPGGLVVRKFPFAFDTPGLATGHIVWTPADGDVLLDAWFDVETAFDGTTPLADVGTFAGANADYGFFQWTTGAIPMSTVVPIDSGLPNEFSPGINTPNVALSATTTSSVIRNVPARLQAVPLKIIVTTTGQSSGADPGATHGAATLYLVTATPA